jgi:predicted SprT family Zn-dependent metalloprotease
VLRSNRQLSFSFLDQHEETKVGAREKREIVVRPIGLDKELRDFCQRRLRGLALDDLAERILVEWNPRMRSTAGRAIWPNGLIQLNPRLVEISQEEVRRTVLHELAHLIAYERHPYRRLQAHGREWQRACADVGIPGERATHQLALPSRTMQRRWRYECPACDKSFERVRRFKSAVACYECCRDSHGGQYHDRFRLIEIRLPV